MRKQALTQIPSIAFTGMTGQGCENPRCAALTDFSKMTLREERASITLAMVQTGIATGNGETFTFTIRPVPTGFRLDNRYRGGCHENTTGAGIWPTVEKAREIAAVTAHRLLSGAVVTWDAE